MSLMSQSCTDLRVSFLQSPLTAQCRAVCRWDAFPRPINHKHKHKGLSHLLVCRRDLKPHPHLP